MSGTANEPVILMSWRRDWPERLAGRKAQGLLKLPQNWVPAFVVTRAVDSTRNVVANLEARRDEICAEVFADATHVLIRSDGPEEGAVPGGAVSRPVEASWEALISGLIEYLDHTGPGTWPLIQRAIEPALLGVMANDRRLSRNSSVWLAEGLLDLRRPVITRLRAADGKRSGALVAKDANSLRRQLRVVAGLLSRHGSRWRCEWVWDGQQLSIVQADPVAERSGDRSAMQYLRRRPYGDPRLWVARDRIDSADTLFAKLRSRSVFNELGLPAPPVSVLRGSEWRALTDSTRWLSDQLAAYPAPLVVRTDAERPGARILLPTSEPSRDPGELGEFIDRVGAEFRRVGLGDEDWIVLLSPLVPARVSALVGATPGSDRARIDALWGHPDGLLSLPHDTFTWDHDAGLAERRVRHKPECLLLDERRRRRATLAAPLDWGVTLRPDELRQIARWAQRLADHARKAVTLMVFCRVDAHRGPDACLPFHFWATEIADSAGDFGSVDAPRDAIRNERDLKRLAHGGAERVVAVKPDADYDRDVGFLRRVGRWAAKAHVVLVFFGSVLGHSSYLLRREGAVVIHLEPREEVRSPRGMIPAVVAPSDGMSRVRLVAEDDVAGVATFGSRDPGSAFAGLPLLEPPASDGLAPPFDAPGQPGLFMVDVADAPSEAASTPKP